MKQRNINQNDLIRYGVTNDTIDRLKKDEHISTYTLNKLCLIIGCTPNDIIEVVATKEELLYLEENKIERKYKKDTAFKIKL